MSSCRWFGSVSQWSVLFPVALLSSGLTAAEPRVTFDTPFAVEARDVSPATFLQSHPQERLVEVRFSISSFIAAGEEEDLSQLVYRIEGPACRFEVADFLPKTRLETRFAGNVAMEEIKDYEADLLVDLAGNYQWLTGATAKFKMHDKEYSHVKAELLPPLEAVAASGTTQRQRGVYFKLRGTERTWLEGEREFAMILRVPQSWRADYVVVRCEADGVRRGIVKSLDERFSAGRREFVVALHLAGDSSARAAAVSVVRAEAELRREAMKQKAEIERRSRSSLSRWGLPTDDVNRIPADWLPKLVQNASPSAAIPDRLPEDVKDAAKTFVAARKRLSELPAPTENALADRKLR